jgi:hypothetical protein
VERKPTEETADLRPDLALRARLESRLTPDLELRARLHSMLITRDFVFLHVPKTGGQFVRRLCHQYLPSERIILNSLNAHSPYEKVATEYPDLPMVAFVRNPWDWYASWYHFFIERPPPPDQAGALWRTVFGEGRNSFRDAVTIACTGEGMGAVRGRELMRERGIDYYSAVHWRIAGVGAEAGRVEMCRFESLGDDFVAFLERHGVPVPEGLYKALKTERAFGQSRRERDYRAYYDDELRDVVGAKAARLIADYGYSFE